MSERLRATGLFVVLAAASALAAGAPGPDRDTPAGAAELKIGVVNVDEIIARYRKAESLRKAEEEKFRGRQEEIAKRTREFNRRIGELQDDAALPEGAERRKRARELEVEKFLLELDVREYRRDKQRAVGRIRRQVADEITAVCRRLGRAEGYDLILRQSKPGGEAGGGPGDDREALAAFERNPVLFAAGSVDLTPRVLDLLEDAFRRGVRLVPGRAGSKGFGAAAPGLRRAGADVGLPGAAQAGDGRRERDERGEP